MDAIKGYKTLAYNTMKILFGALIAAGVMTPEQQQVVFDNLDSILGAIFILDGVIGTVLRKVTNSSLFNK